MINKLTFASVLLGLFVAAQARVQTSDLPSCLDENGDLVDWYIAYKFPELTDQEHIFKSGYAYAYLDSKDVQGRTPSRDKQSGGRVVERLRDGFSSFLDLIVPTKKEQGLRTPHNSTREKRSTRQWTVSEKLITDPKSIVLRTLEVAYNNKPTRISETLNSIFYNDGPPEQHVEGRSGQSQARAHAKGVLLIDDVTNNGVWLTHSTPQFPPPRNMKLRFNENSRKYGQTFMCINFNLDRSGIELVNHLITMHPLVYDSKISDKLYTLLPEIRSLTGKRKRGRKTDTKLAQVIKTRAGQSLNLYSKSADFDDDMYAGWIDKELGSALYVETWRNGAGTPLNSSCPRDNYRVNNVQDLKVINSDNSKVTWSYHQDHSKWAISDSADHGVVCISDINRMKSQFKRGGGAVCIKCSSCWSVFSDTIVDLEPCPVGHPKRTTS